MTAWDNNKEVEVLESDGELQTAIDELKRYDKDIKNHLIALAKLAKTNRMMFQMAITMLNNLTT